ncbi:MAG: protein-glutamate O-methyltransferase CheR [Fibrobacterota bacterium]
MASLTDSEFRQLRTFIEQSCGICVGDEKAYLIESRLSGLMVQAGCTGFTEFYQKAVGDRTLGLRDKIVDAMTTNETLWFRDTHPFKILEEAILRPMADEILAGRRKKIRIWSAACSTGQEPYSIAMTLQEFARRHSVLPLEYVEIIATDISPSALFLAQAGRYDKLSISRGLPEEMRNRYFEAVGSLWVLKDNIKKMVTFRKFNLQESLTGLGHFDIVFCRNVAIYFSEPFKKDLLLRLARTLRPDGFLFIGASESLTHYTAEFLMMTIDKGMYYRVKPEVL